MLSRTIVDPEQEVRVCRVARQQFFIDSEVVMGEVVPPFIGVAEHVQHIPAGSSQ